VSPIVTDCNKRRSSLLVSILPSRTNLAEVPTITSKRSQPLEIDANNRQRRGSVPCSILSSQLDSKKGPTVSWALPAVVETPEHNSQQLNSTPIFYWIQE
jgi:hypothetical protein